MMYQKKKRTFRNYHVAAPLKPNILHVPSGFGGSFRNYHVAAPLKLVDVHVRRVLHYNLPQLSCCGPIEAGRDQNYDHDSEHPSATIMLRPH